MMQALVSRRLERCHNIDDLRREAKRRLPTPVFDFIDGGADDEVTLADNRRAYGRYSLVPRQCAGLERESVDLSTTVLGQQLAWPVFTSPWGLQTLIHAHGEVGLAQAAHDSGTAFALSSFSGTRMEAVAEAAPGPRFFQLQPARSWEIMDDLMDRARRAGYTALLLTVDNPTHGNRERDHHNGFDVPQRFTLASWLSIASHPGWALSAACRKLEFANYAKYLSPPERDTEWLFEQTVFSVDWEMVARLAARWDGPFAIKGILSPEDAVRAADAGVSAVVVSNQGARHFDYAPATFDVLPEICEAVGERVEVILDGGIRRGADVLTALALGARACMTGRPFAYGLAAGGRIGAARALSLLKSEIHRDMLFLGAADLSQITTDYLRARVP